MRPTTAEKKHAKRLARLGGACASGRRAEKARLLAAWAKVVTRNVASHRHVEQHQGGNPLTSLMRVARIYGLEDELNHIYSQEIAKRLGGPSVRTGSIVLRRRAR